MLAGVTLALLLASLVGAWTTFSAVGRHKAALARRTAIEIETVLGAARAFRMEEGRWPGSVAELSAGGWLTPGWDGRNPWGGDYRLRPEGELLLLETEVPRDAHPWLRARVPGGASSGDTFTAFVQPGIDASSAGDDLVSVEGDRDERTMGDDLHLGGRRVRTLGRAVDPDDALPWGQAEDRYVNLDGDVVTGDLVVTGRVESSAFAGPGGVGDRLDPAGTSRLEREHLVRDVYLRRLGMWVSSWEPRPGRWECTEGSDQGYSSCCPRGYVLVSHTCNGSGCSFSVSNGRMCVWGVNPRTVCCR